MAKGNFLTVQSGRYKGKKIPLPSAVRGNVNCTPALLKKALFSILDSMHLSGEIDRTESVFADLFGGSGQMGFEAVSQGFGASVIFEIDSERQKELKKLFENYPGEISCFKRDAFRQYDMEEIMKYQYRIYFLDFPYSFWKKDSEKLHRLCTDILSLPGKNFIFVQSPENPDWPEFTFRQAGNSFLLSSTSDK